MAPERITPPPAKISGCLALPSSRSRLLDRVRIASRAFRSGHTRQQRNLALREQGVGRDLDFNRPRPARPHGRHRIVDQ